MANSLSKSTLQLGTDQHDLARAAHILKQGGTVAFATETVYGLGANGLCSQAVQKIYEAKNRIANNPLILHVASTEQALALFDLEKASITFLKRFHALASQFWPGPLTLIGPKAAHIPSLVTAQLPKVAVRVPSHPVAQALLKLVDLPLAAPSANASLRPSPTEAKHVLATLDGKIDAVVDGGFAYYGIESTVVDISEAVPRLLRPGAICATRLRSVLGDLAFPEHIGPNSASPGQQEKHYAPNIASIEMGDLTKMATLWFSDAALLLRQSTHLELSRHLGKRASSLTTHVLPDTPGDAARALYRMLYELEQQAPARLCVEQISDQDEAWRAVQDRLKRACAQPSNHV